MYGLTAVLLGSGATWLASRYLEIPQRNPEGWAALAMRVHGAAAMATLAVVGGIAGVHAASAWREGRNRASGIALGATLVVMAITGYVLYYAGAESARSLASVSHWILGLGLPGVLAAHALLGRRS